MIFNKLLEQAAIAGCLIHLEKEQRTLRGIGRECGLHPEKVRRVLQDMKEGNPKLVGEREGRFHVTAAGRYLAEALPQAKELLLAQRK